jgi:leucyl-tRNA synthetase
LNIELLTDVIEKLITIMSPFAPHFAEELWEIIGNEGSVYLMDWPKYDEDALIKDEIEIVVQVNGKVKERLVVSTDITKEDLEKAALNDEKIVKLIDGKKIVKVIVVPSKLVNIVIK